MTKAEQPTITQALDALLDRRAKLVDDVRYYSGNEKAGYEGIAALDGEIVKHVIANRTTSLAAQDGLVEALGEALFNLSAKLNEAGFLKDDANHAAYEKVVSAFNGVSAIKGDKS